MIYVIYIYKYILLMLFCFQKLLLQLKCFIFYNVLLLIRIRCFINILSIT